MDGRDEQEFVAHDPDGRRFSDRRRVRLGDVTVSGRLRLDALARYLQDIAGDDADDAGIADPWVLRRLTLRVDRWPWYRDDVELVTWCSGASAGAAERRTTLRVGGDVVVEAAALWVFVDADGRPARLSPRFFELYGGSAGGRKVATRLRHPDPPTGVTARPWPLREADVDLLRHVNNAVFLAAVEDALADGTRPGEREAAAPRSAEFEYRAAIDPGSAPELAIDHTPDHAADRASDRLACWFVCDGTVRASAVVTLGGPGIPGARA